MPLNPDDVFRDHNTKGVPASGEYKPEKALVRRLLKEMIGGTAAIGDYQGAWDSGTDYIASDLTESGGSIWYALRANTNVTPVEGADWTLFLPGVTAADGTITLAKLATSLTNYLDARFVQVNPVDTMPTICLTFDYYENAMSQAKPIADVYSLPGTYFAPLSMIDQPGGPTLSQLTLAKATGWEIGAYSETNWVTAEATDRNALVAYATSIKQGFADLGLPVVSLAPNQRAWNGKLRNLMADGVFERIRVVDNFFTVDGYFQELPVPDLLWVKDGGSPSLTTSDTGASLSAQVDQLIALGGLWTVVIHNVSDTGDVNYRVTPAAFNTFCNKIQNEVTAGNLRAVCFRDIKGA